MSSEARVNHGWTVADLFSGCGGMSWGFDRDARYRILGAVDRQTAKPSEQGRATTSCNETYALNIGVEPLDIDIFKLDPGEWRENALMLERGKLDVLISCAPCTGFSQKNASNHVRDDRRNSLVARTADFVEELLPRVLVMENVKELLQGRNIHHFVALRQRLEYLGYDVTAEVHQLADFGLPQLRRRAVVIAHRDGPVVPILPPVVPVHRTVRDVIGEMPRLTAGAQDPHDPMHICGSPNARSMDRIRAIPQDGGSWSDLLGTADEHLLIPSMLRPDRRRGSFPDVYGRLWWDEPARTITRECGHAGNGRYLHPEQDRHLSVREMALLQGFPPEYQFVGRLGSKYNQIGDAVPPMISDVIAKHVASLLDGSIGVVASRHQLTLAA